MSMHLPYSDELNLGYLSRIFDNKSECYKLFWFKAILLKVNEGKTEFSYDELINQMIVDAWYMVTEYHLNLGDNCIEYENGYVFCADKGKDQVGGYYSPIVILKEDGKAVDMPQFVVNGTGKELKSFSL